MAGRKTITQLSPAGTLTGTEEIAVWQDSATRKAALSAVFPSGTYTPTLTSVTNVAASTSTSHFRWFRVGLVVYVSGQIDIDPTAGSTLTSLGITLPVASNLALARQLSGIAVMDNGTVMTLGRIQGDATNDRAQLDFYSDSGAANRAWQIQFSYVVL